MRLSSASRGVIAVAIAAPLLLGACTGDHATPATPVPSPTVGQFLPANYRLVHREQAHLTSARGPADVVLVSTGPGLDPSQPVAGGTSDVQVLSYDAAAARWNLVFDAAANVATFDTARPRSPLSNRTTSGPEPLLPQTDPISDVKVDVVHLSAGPPDLLVYGLDAATNHPVGRLGVVDLHSSGNGSARVVYADAGINVETPTVTRRDGRDTITVHAPWYTINDPACCPIRSYVQVIGETRAAPHEAPTVSVISDDRPWLGAWVAKPTEGSGPPVVVTTVDGSPASPLLRPGDRITAVDSIPTVKADDLLGLTVLDLIARHHSGEQVKLAVARGDTPLAFTIVLGSVIDTSATTATTPVQYRIGIGGAPAAVGSSPGVVVAAVDGPAAAAGIAPGDTVTAIGPVTVRDVTDLATGVLASGGRPVTVTYRSREGGTGSTVVAPQVADPATTPALLPAAC